MRSNLGLNSRHSRPRPTAGCVRGRASRMEAASSHWQLSPSSCPLPRHGQRQRWPAGAKSASNALEPFIGSCHCHDRARDHKLKVTVRLNQTLICVVLDKQLEDAWIRLHLHLLYASRLLQAKDTASRSAASPGVAGAQLRSSA